MFTTDFLNMLADAGVESVQLPARSPNLNAFAEGFVRSIEEFCLDQMISEKHNSDQQGPVECRERLGGMLKYYYRAAA